MDIDMQNKEWQDALQIVNFTRRSLFLTGKAGTGKSTFLRYVAEHTKKKNVILAPTGIAAINAGGATLHSFFKLPFHPLLPNDTRYDRRHIKETQKYTSEQRKLLREVELIIIDEISMVRADIIDFIDKVLRIYNRSSEPFGGKQLLLVGDIYQLEPVLKEEDRQLLRPFYQSAYFFNAKVWQQMQLVSIELRKVYRQKDGEFISLLDRIRQNRATEGDLAALNSRVESKVESAGHALCITLATRRDTVDFINEQRLSELPGDADIFHGVIKGDFPQSSVPTPVELSLKPGAQVIFVKNDKDKRWVNGTLGTVTEIDGEAGIVGVQAEDGRCFRQRPRLPAEPCGEVGYQHIRVVLDLIQIKVVFVVIVGVLVIIQIGSQVCLHAAVRSLRAEHIGVIAGIGRYGHHARPALCQHRAGGHHVHKDQDGKEKGSDDADALLMLLNESGGLVPQGLSGLLSCLCGYFLCAATGTGCGILPADVPALYLTGDGVAD